MNYQTNSQHQVNTSVRLEPSASGLLTVWLDTPRRSVNVVDSQMLAGLEAAVEHVTACREQYQAILFRSRKSGSFFVGADVQAIQSLKCSTEADAIVTRGQALMNNIASLPMPTIAAIDGSCLGGGLELALACDYRVASRNQDTRLAVPEIKLGLIPGWGGTQRLPAIVGLQQALLMILTGKSLGAERALAVGLVDLLIDMSVWEHELTHGWQDVLEACRTAAPRSKSLFTRLIDDTWLGRQLALKLARRRIATQRRHYPALEEALNAVTAACRTGSQAFDVERKAFGRLLFTETAQSLIGLFLARDRAKKISSWVDVVPVTDPAEGMRKVAVIGAGAMGAGIGTLAATKGFEVVFKEIHAGAAEAGRRRTAEILQKQVDRQQLSEQEMQAACERMQFTDHWQDIADCDLAIEAVVEIESVKREVFAMLDRTLRPDAILASNTSSLSVSRMPTAGRRRTTAGLHFFNPVERMELVEVVRSEAVNEKTVAALLAFVKAIGKTPIVTSDKPGFLVNRVLFPYLGEAVRMVASGYDVEQIDRQMRSFGMPMGPCELIDKVGVDIANHVADSLSSVQPDAAGPSQLLAFMVERNWLGKKSGCGFYGYDSTGRKTPNELLPREAIAPPVIADVRRDCMTEIQRRLVYPMLNEAVHCLDELVVTEPWMCDLAMVLGTGFAPMHGGPIRLIDQLEPATVLHNMQSLVGIFGSRFAPADGLIRRVRRHAAFQSSIREIQTWENRHEPRYSPQP